MRIRTVITCILLTAGALFAVPSKTQSAKLDDTGTNEATSIQLAFASNVTAGNFIIGIARWPWNTTTVTGVTDTLGNTYSYVQTANSSGFGGSVLFYALNISGGANTVTVAITDSRQHRSMIVEEWSGIATSSALDATGTAIVQSTNSTTCQPSVTSTNASDVIFAYVATISNTTSTPTIDSSFTVDEYNTNGAIASLVVAATGTYNSTFTVTTNKSNCQAFAFKQSGGAAPIRRRVLVQ